MDEVKEMESCFVAPSEGTPRQGLWLSPLDIILANRGHTPTVYFYRRDAAAASIATDFFDVGRLKKAMAKALVAFYPLAGRLCVDGDGRPEIDCNAEGALFVVARSELTVDTFSDFKPSPELRRLFVPRIEPASIVLGIQSLDWCDGDAAVVELPCHDRTLLRVHSPPVIHPDTHSMFSLKLNLCEPLDPISTKIFPISEDQLATLKRICGGTSTFCAVSALLWQCVARRLPLDAETCVTFPVNIRHRVRPPLPDRYFSNALVIMKAASTVKDIVLGTLAATAAHIKTTLGRLNGEMLQSVIDYNEMAGMSNQPAKGNLPDTELRMIGWLGMPVYDADFGWGKPQVMSHAESVRGGFVYMMNGTDNSGGGVRVLMCMEAVKIECERLLYAKFA
ncbi:hypothetical protein E2562_017447 [Oryza meyeriana var. granulata]|uniref:Uncharacterized protein n=1 Tax=Oryza meyeriana var. granulata TaxID=110450 RepID=A0A6G1DXD4_9ORYZ|nr:hypothetical protein E2562_017447 [Oryza meyeriana var. granulata]